MWAIPRASILIYLGLNDLSTELPEILHPQFFIPYTDRDKLIREFTQHANTISEMDVYLPTTSVDLIHPFYDPLKSGRHFHIYCETEELVQRYERTTFMCDCEVYHINEIDEKLNSTANRHLQLAMTDLGKRGKRGDVDALDLLGEIVELYGRSATKLIDDMRRKVALSQEAAEVEER